LLAPLLLRLDHEAVGLRVAARLESHRRLAPRGLGHAPARRLRLAAAVRVVARRHDHATDLRPAAHVPLVARAAALLVFVVDVPELADRRAAADVDDPDRARREPDLGVLALLRHELGDPAGGAHELPAAAGLELAPGELRAGRDVLERHAVPKTRFRIGPREHAVTDLQIERRQDVPLLAVLVAEEREPGRAIRVVLDRDHLRRDAVL